MSALIDLEGIRRVKDEGGVTWEVWEAHPRLAERRRMRDRRAHAREGVHERRLATSDQRALSGEPGWLVFRSVHEERRRTPIPEGWEWMSERDLVGVLRGSRATAPMPRLRSEEG